MKKIYTVLLLTTLTTVLLGQKNTNPLKDFKNPFTPKPSIKRTTLVPQAETEPYSATQNGATYFIKIKKGRGITKQNVFPSLQAVFDLQPTDGFALLKTETDDLGWTHYRYQQLYNNIPVFGGQIIVHEKDGAIKLVNGNFYKQLDLPTSGTITEAVAIQKAIQHINAEQYQWEVMGNEQFHKRMNKDNPNATLRPTAKLIIAPDNFANPDFKLTYKIRINAQKPYGIYDVYVDALTGTIVTKINGIAHIDAPGTAQTRYSGIQNITADDTGNGFRLRESGRGIQTFDMRNGTDFNAAVDFVDDDNSWMPSGFALTRVQINNINDDWYTTFSEHPSAGGLPDLFIVVGDSLDNVIYVSGTAWNVSPALAFTNINVSLVAGSPYTFQIWDNDNSSTAHDILGSFSFIPTVTGTFSFSGSGNDGTITIGDVQADAGLDAHWGMEKTYDFYQTKLGRNSYDNAGGLIRSFVHFDNGMENAFWESNNEIMVFGDGASTFSALTSLDVAGHEFSHAVITNSADLIYQGEAGALNESFADIFGVAIEFFAKPNSANWEIGDEITIVAPNHLRSMSNPNGGLTPQPDTYQGTHWADPNNLNFDHGGVHINSGVQNYWFYLLANGGTGTNDQGIAFNVMGIGLDDATNIAYRNLTTYLTQTSNFLAAVTGSLQAAEDLFGAGSTQYNAVQTAWYAVGLANSPSSFCSGNVTLNTETGTFSDGSGSSDYDNNADCSWLISPSGAGAITLSFSSFDTEAGFDSVKVYDGANANAPLLLEWTGNSIPDTVTSTGGAMFVRFVSDGNTTGAGWEANYTSSNVTVFCNGGVNLNSASGTISDGSGAADYGNNAFCYWQINPAGATSITLDFTSFDTEEGVDGVVVYDGLSTNGTELLNWSGQTLPNSVTAASGEMLVLFISDASVTSGGFEANYTITGGNDFCSDSLITDDFITIVDGSGNNSDYYNNTNCTWLIQPPNATAITLIWKEFNLELPAPDGSTIYDFVEVFDGADDSAPLLGTFTGQSIPPTLTSSGGSMFLRFKTDGSVTAGGWMAEISTATSTYCSGNTILTDASGSFSDGSGGNQYGNASECTWLIQPSNPSNIHLDFTTFNTERDYDFVIVYDGVDENAPQIGVFSGTTIPPTISSNNSDGALFLVFLSDESIREAGWEAAYVSFPVSTERVKNQYKIQIYPNPFENKMLLEFELDSYQEVSIRVFDVLGQTILAEQLGQSTIGRHQHRLNTNRLAAGTYIVQIQIGDQVATQKMVKMK